MNFGFEHTDPGMSLSLEKRAFRDVTKTESHFHKIMKNTVATELEKQNFTTFAIIQNKNRSNQRRTNQTNERWLDIRKRRWRGLVFQKTQVKSQLNECRIT